MWWWRGNSHERGLGSGAPEPNKDRHQQHMSTSAGLTTTPTHSTPPPAAMNHPHVGMHLDAGTAYVQAAPPPPAAALGADVNGSPAPNRAKKRKKGSGAEDDGAHVPSEPRRLRRSHEACARCRSKKIKCDSKHPRCTACTTANVQCEQEDRHRQTLTPRGYTERIEAQLYMCEKLLQKHIPGFNIDQLEELCIKEGIDINPDIQGGWSPRAVQKLPLTFPAPMPPPGGPLMYPPPLPPPGWGWNPMLGHPHFGPIPILPPDIGRVPSQTGAEVKGRDPNSNDLSDPQGIAKSFGVSPSLVSSISSSTAPVANGAAPLLFNEEDIAVGNSGLTSGRDRFIHGPSPAALLPRDAAHWFTIALRRPSISSVPPGAPSPEAAQPYFPNVDIWLPRDKDLTRHIVQAYFERLNVHRPVFDERSFTQRLEDVYDTEGKHPSPVVYDEGWVCSLYLMLALGTLSELNWRSAKSEQKVPVKDGDVDMDKGSSLPATWPSHEEFFARALAIKQDLRVTMTSLQALIMLHWYLYCETQGRNLWRLVGSLVRLSIELGLHHDPTTQFIPRQEGSPPDTKPTPVFSEEECALRIRLWGIVLIHDRGTSIQLGRPLAISPSDSNTPLTTWRPTNGSDSIGGDNFAKFSQHFQHSHGIVSIQADIIQSLYVPSARQNVDATVRNAVRILKSLTAFRRSLPENYQKYFKGTTTEIAAQGHGGKNTCVEDITEDEGLTVLKIGITRIMLLRSIFASNDIDYGLRMMALVGAISTAHNMIIIHNQLIRFPDIAFFTSPIPLHIGAMVILAGHMSKAVVLSNHMEIEDLWLALDMLPRFRWRWERKDMGGEHPFLMRLSEMVLNISLRERTGPAGMPVLLEEKEFGEEELQGGIVRSPPSRTLSQQQVHQQQPQTPQTPTQQVVQQHPGTPTSNGAPVMYASNGSKMFANMPSSMFYPFFPAHDPRSLPGGSGMSGTPVSPSNTSTTSPPSAAATPSTPTGSAPGNYADMLKAVAVSQPDAIYGCQPSQDAYINEERGDNLFSPHHYATVAYPPHHQPPPHFISLPPGAMPPPGMVPVPHGQYGVAPQPQGSPTGQGRGQWIAAPATPIQAAGPGGSRNGSSSGAGGGGGGQPSRAPY